LSTRDTVDTWTPTHGLLGQPDQGEQPLAFGGADLALFAAAAAAEELFARARED
jgi:hypothetical protein